MKSQSLRFSRRVLMLLTLHGVAHADPSEIVVIGDSQSQGSLGKETLKSLRKGEQTTTSYYARPGSVAQWWLDGSKAKQPWSSWNAPQGERELRVTEALPAPKIESLIKKHQPKLVVVQLGGNMAYQSEDEIRKSTLALVKRIRNGGSQCLWIGPNPGEKRPEPAFTRTYTILKEVTAEAGCEFFDSRKAFKGIPKGGDGIHIDTMTNSKALAKNWSDAIVQASITALRKSQATASPGSKGVPLKTHR